MKRKKKSKIMIVDDERHFREELKAFLMEEGYIVTAVENGYLALEEARRQHFDVAILDLVMPGIDGFETCHGLHKIAGDTQVIMLTSNVSVETVAKSASERIRDYIPKSSIQQLLVAIRKVLKMKPATRDASGKVLTPPAQMTQTAEYLFAQNSDKEAATFWYDAGKVYRSMHIWEAAAVNFEKAAEIWSKFEHFSQLASDSFNEAAEMFRRINQHQRADNLEKRAIGLQEKIQKGNGNGT